MNELKIEEHLSRLTTRFTQTGGLQVEGRLVRMVGLTMEAVGCSAAIGSKCQIINSNGEKIEAEVVGFADDKTFLMSTGNVSGIAPGARVIPSGGIADVSVGSQLLGRVIDAAARPIDAGPELDMTETYPLFSDPINPLLRTPIKESLDVGVRAINTLLTIGRGQRIGLFAGSGVGKSVLLGMMTRFTTADVIVVGLIGERGREVKEFIEENLGPEGLRRSIVVAVPADQSPLMRINGAYTATAIAEYFRDCGSNVLLLIDSLTRFAQAQREIALSIGEPPATKGFPPSVFAKIPQLVERAGNGSGKQGSITAFYTVLIEGDDHHDPIADCARSILDGHIFLSRSLAQVGHFPAIDVEASLSRVMSAVASADQQMSARVFRSMYSKYQQNKDLINIGAYVAGSDPDVDYMINNIAKFDGFLQQGMDQRSNFQESLNELKQVITR